jgi:GR25 family glycosyltransferase involved in LPS biosynthesis
VSVCALVIHLRRAAARRPQVDKLLQTLPFAPAVLDAVDAESLTDAEIARVYRPGLHRPHYPFALRRTEVACFLSHRAAWRRIVEEGHEAGLIVEDDVAFEPSQLGPMLDFAHAGLQPGDYLRLPYRSRGERGRVLASRAGMTLAEPAVVGLGMQMQLVTRLAAERALGATEMFDRPVDTTLQMRWLTGVRMLTLRPVVIREIGGVLGGTTVQKKKKPLGEAVLREVKRASYRMSLRLASLAARP